MEEDVEYELLALQALYPEECRVARSWPPHLELLLRPRTADDASQQFVEVALGMVATQEYPAVPPSLQVKSAKGLDEQRQNSLLSLLHHTLSALINCPMLIAVAEAAADFLTRNNYPEGDCCFCMLPLDRDHSSLVKLLSCFHCFHRHCFARWWRWLHSDGAEVKVCPTCRSEIRLEDTGHLAYLLSEQPPEEDPATLTMPEDVPSWEVEAERRKHYARYFQLQQARNGIIEKLEVIQPGMVVVPRRNEPDPHPSTSATATGTLSGHAEGKKGGVVHRSARRRRQERAK